MLDVLLRNAQIIDGTGAPRRNGHVGIREGQIVAIGDIDESATQTINVDGAIVAPGFIDIHTHYDAQVLWDPTLSPSILHGVTTVVGGNCGFSLAPLTTDGAPYLMSMLAHVEGMPLSALESALAWDWSTTADYLARVEGTVAPNVGFMVGHTAIRRSVMGEAAKERIATPEEIAVMQDVLRAGLAAGGLGFSSSIAVSHNDAEGDPVPSRCASYDEILALAAVCGEFEGTCLEMVPYVGVDLFPEKVMDLMVEMTSRSARSLNWNILHALASNIDEVEGKLAVSDRARSAGGKIVGLLMPMPIELRLNFLSGFVLDMLPGWDKLMALPASQKMTLLSSPEGRAEMRRPTEGTSSRFAQWGNYLFAECFSDSTRRYQGRTVGDIAREQKKDPFDVLADAVVADGLKTSFGFGGMGKSTADWEAVGRTLQDRRIVVGASDAGAHLDMIDTFRYTTAMLANCVREHQLIDLEGAVHLLTQVPAQLHGLRNRGVLREGSCADIVIFDEETVGSAAVHTRTDLPGGEPRLFAESTGVQYVIVNGQPIVDHGEVTHNRPGRVLRSGTDTETAPLLD